MAWPIESSPRSPVPAIRAFSVALWWVRIPLAVVTVIAVPLLALTVAGRGSLSIKTQVDRPYAITFADGRSIAAGAADAPDVWSDFTPGEEKLYLRSPPRVEATLRLAPGDTDARAVLAAMVGLWLAAAWAALIALRRVVNAARLGEPFHPSNVRRVRTLASVALLFPFANLSIAQLLRRTADTDIPVHFDTPGPSWWVCVIAGLGFLALAEVFRQGAALRELERSVI